jgi:hypothetical protein
MADEAHRLIVDPMLAPGRRGVVAGGALVSTTSSLQRLQLPQKLPDGAGAQDHRHVGVLNQRTQEVQLEVARQRGQRADADHLPAPLRPASVSTSSSPAAKARSAQSKAIRPASVNAMLRPRRSNSA